MIYCTCHLFYFYNTITGGVDYDSGPYTVTFPAGVTSVSFDVPIFEDDIVEDDEYIVLSIISNLLSSGVNQDYPNTTMIVIAKNDSKSYHYNIQTHDSNILYSYSTNYKSSGCYD